MGGFDNCTLMTFCGGDGIFYLFRGIIIQVRISFLKFVWKLPVV